MNISMKVIQKGFELTKIEYFKTHLKIINAVLPINITDKEIEVLSTFLSLPRIDNNIFSSTARKKVMSQCDISPGGLSNHLRNMKDKHFLIMNNNCYSINEALLPDDKAQGYSFKLKIKNQDNE